MKRGDIYVYIGDSMEHPNVFDTTFINVKQAIKFEKFRIIFVKDEWDYCYVVSLSDKSNYGNIFMKCIKSALITKAEYRRMIIDSFL